MPSQMKNKFGWGGAVFHTLIFCSLSTPFFQALSHGPKKAEDAVAYILIFLLPLDLPALILAGMIAGPFKKFSPDLVAPTLMGLLFLFGTVQWYWIGVGIGKLWKKLAGVK